MRIKMLAVDKESDSLPYIHHRWYIAIPVQCTVQGLTIYWHHLILEVKSLRTLDTKCHRN